MILSEERPALQGFDQDRWASLFRYGEVLCESALAQLGVLRDAKCIGGRLIGYCSELSAIGYQLSEVHSRHSLRSRCPSDS
jgi:hypothetical protein